MAATASDGLTEREARVPDLEWAKKHVSITQAADLLGMEIIGKQIRCWRPENHQHGDRTPSVGIHFQRNRVKCFVCDPRWLSVVDLVQSRVNLDTYGALKWLDTRFEIPRIPSGKHLSEKSKGVAPFRVGTTGNRLEAVVRSGLWSEMSTAEARTLKVLDIFTDSETGLVTLSYTSLKRYSGLKSDASVRKAIVRLKNLHALEIIPRRGDDGFPGVNSYRLTLEDARFLTLLNETYKKTREEIEAQRRFRAEARIERRARISQRRAPSLYRYNLSSPTKERDGLLLQLGEARNENTVKICSAYCAGCYEVAPGVRIHPPKCGAGWVQ